MTEQIRMTVEEAGELIMGLAEKHRETMTLGYATAFRSQLSNRPITVSRIQNGIRLDAEDINCAYLSGDQMVFHTTLNGQMTKSVLGPASTIRLALHNGTEDAVLFFTGEEVIRVNNWGEISDLTDEIIDKIKEL